MTNKLFQYSTITSLVQGNYDGEISYKEAMGHGDFGLGTFDALNGEMIALNGEFWQMLSDGTVKKVGPTMTSPFLSVCHFEESESFGIGTVPMDEIKSYIVRKENKNKVIAFMIEGTFKIINTRTVSAQEKPYKKMYEINSLQSDLTFKDVSGTIVGFYTPKYLNTIGVEGIHCHFINDERTSGGHVKSYLIDVANIKLCVLDGVDLTFGKNTFSNSDVQHHIKKVEG